MCSQSLHIIKTGSFYCMLSLFFSHLMITLFLISNLSCLPYYTICHRKLNVWFYVYSKSHLMLTLSPMLYCLSSQTQPAANFIFILFLISSSLFPHLKVTMSDISNSCCFTFQTHPVSHLKLMLYFHLMLSLTLPKLISHLTLFSHLIRTCSHLIFKLFLITSFSLTSSDQS